jgi:hypothetical protein
MKLLQNPCFVAAPSMLWRVWISKKYLYRDKRTEDQQEIFVQRQENIENISSVSGVRDEVSE